MNVLNKHKVLDFKVTCDESNNSEEGINNDILNVDIKMVPPNNIPDRAIYNNGIFNWVEASAFIKNESKF